MDADGVPVVEWGRTRRNLLHGWVWRYVRQARRGKLGEEHSAVARYLANSFRLLRSPQRIT